LQVEAGDVEVGFGQVELVYICAAMADVGGGHVACEGVRVEEADVVQQEVVQGHFHPRSRRGTGFGSRFAGEGVDNELVVKDAVGVLAQDLGRQVAQMYFFDIQVIVQQSQHSQADVD